MKAYRIKDDHETRIVVVESIENIRIGESNIEELCEVESACIGGFSVINSDGVTIVADYYLESGVAIDDDGLCSQIRVDIKKTNEILSKEDAKFADWDFNFWVGTYFNGYNWEVIVAGKE